MTYIDKLIHLIYIAEKTKKIFLYPNFFTINTLSLILIKNMDKKNKCKRPNLQFDHAHSKAPVKIPANLKFKGLAMAYRVAKKICRKCYCRLPVDSKICRKCKNSDLRY